MKPLITIIVAAAIVFGIWHWHSKKTNIVVTTTTLQTYTDPEGVFSFQYPKEFQISGRENSFEDWIYARVKVPKDYMPQTNFDDAELVVKVQNRMLLADCKDSHSSEGAAGNIYTSVDHRIMHNQECWDISYTVHSGNIGNYDPSQGIKEFDKNKIEAPLKAMQQSFKFLK